MAEIRNKDYGSALFYFGEALQVNPNSVEARELAGNIYLAQGQLDFAFEHFNRAVELDPIRDGLLYALGFIEYQRGNIEEARKWFARALEVNPENVKAGERLEDL